MDTTDSTILHIRTARTVPAQQAQDAAMAAALEAICFPPEQAASPTTIAERMAYYADHFWLIEDESGTLLALVNGLCTNERDLSDEMYESPTMHDPDGAWQMIFGVATAPAAQGQGLATRLLRTVIETTRAHGRQGLVLTCLDDLVAFYARLGFVDEGLSPSNHGGVPWHQMRLTLT
ncbi:GNAT family N-acetyltransferase [Actinomyces sp. ZJ308]|uniref:GNAT family N-acetyltransferase n=1 Tax=Actinomyces sp. ZJ308 TaxID=2708342 RepID=UPI001422E095|nr:GNAT family N-acetyltransferase [Actinomyces sp. ZJ308]